PRVAGGATYPLGTRRRGVARSPASRRRRRRCDVGWRWTRARDALRAIGDLCLRRRDHVAARGTRVRVAAAAAGPHTRWPERPRMSTDETHRAIEAVWRIEAPKLIASLTRFVHDIGLAEDLAQDALIAALEQWPYEGVPQRPGAWLMAAAKRRAIDGMRRHAMLDRKHAELGRELDERQDATVRELDESLDDEIGDDLLRLIFTACHPVLSMEARVALTLRLLGGLSTDEIARAFLVPEPTIAQRIVRAKRTIAKERARFEVPRGSEFDERVSSVLAVIYLIFNEGYTATAGKDWTRPDL